MLRRLLVVFVKASIMTNAHAYSFQQESEGAFALTAIYSGKSTERHSFSMRVANYRQLMQERLLVMQQSRASI